MTDSETDPLAVEEHSEHSEEHSEHSEHSEEHAPEPEAGQFDADYVKRLRAEAARHRTAAKDAEAELAELRAERDRRTIADLAGRLADPDDLARYVQLDELRGDDGRYEEGKVAAAVAGLLERRPHLGAPRVGLGQGRRPLVASERSAGDVLADVFHKRV